MQNKDINQFRMNFTSIYHKQVVPALKAFESERIKTARIAKLCAGLAFVVIAGLLFFIMLASGENILKPALFSLFFGGVPAYLIYRFFKKSFELKIKEFIMPVLMPAFGDMEWNNLYGIGEGEIRMSKLFTRFEYMKNDDNFSGSYKEMPIRITETELTYETTDSKGRRQTHTEFKGVLISVEIPKNFTGHTIVKKRSLINSAPYKEVKLEDVEFSKEFYVSSTDQIEARYLLTAAFMQRYKNIQKAFGANNIECSFLHNRLLIAVSVNKDLFSLGDLNRPVTDTKQFTVFLNEIISIYEMIEELKLYQNIGM